MGWSNNPKDLKIIIDSISVKVDLVSGIRKKERQI